MSLLLGLVACGTIALEAVRMTRKFLEEYRQLKAKEKTLEELHDQMLGWGGHNPHKSEDLNRDGVGLLALKRVGVEETLQEVRARLLLLTPQLESFIAEVAQDDVIAASVINFRYAEALTWKQVAERVHGSADSCRMCALRYLERKCVK